MELRDSAPFPEFVVMAAIEPAAARDDAERGQVLMYPCFNLGAASSRVERNTGEILGTDIAECQHFGLGVGGVVIRQPQAVAHADIRLCEHGLQACSAYQGADIRL